MDYSIIIPSNKPVRQTATKLFLRKEGFQSISFDGSNYPSFSKLINDSVLACPTEIVIICNDKARPSREKVIKMLDLINQGYGLVGLYCFGFFGFKKELFRQIGPLDERFLGGNFEDCDYLRRLNEANIACYFTYEIPYLEQGSSWNTGLSRIWFHDKWIDATPENLICTRLQPEESYGYELGPPVPTRFLPWPKSHIPDSAWFVDVKIESKL